MIVMTWSTLWVKCIVKTSLYLNLLLENLLSGAILKFRVLNSFSVNAAIVIILLKRSSTAFISQLIYGHGQGYAWTPYPVRIYLDYRKGFLQESVDSRLFRLNLFYENQIGYLIIANLLTRIFARMVYQILLELLSLYIVHWLRYI